MKIEKPTIENYTNATHTHSAASSGGIVSNQLVFIIDGGGSVITTGAKTWIRVPKTCTITEWILTADQSGSIVIDIWKDTYANFPPTVADTITASAKPTLSSQQKNSNNVLTGWTTALTENDYLRFNVDSVSTVTKITLILKYS